MAVFEISDCFRLDGEPFQIISGSIHYFRIVPEYWRDRLEKLVNMGCNAVETYIPWNYHEPERGKFLWEGNRDVCRFIETAQELGLYVILRPSPYICAEWEFGGLPAWLLKDGNMRLRCSYKPYLDAVEEYYSQLIPKLVPYQITNGGRVILMQIENEYGYYGNDKAYLRFLRDTMRRLGVTVPLVTSDGPWKESAFRSGSVEGALPTGNFGSAAQWQFSQMEKFSEAAGPLMCMEFWNGWFDAWGEEHHITPPEKAASELDDLLKLGSLNFYMFNGGTNFGFMSGKNGGAKNCDVTSYDYDAPLTEDGQITPKYKLFREIIGRYRAVKEIPLTTDIRRRAYGKIPCCAKADLFSVINSISEPEISPYPVSMEELGSYYGYVLYRTKLPEWESAETIRLEDAADRVQCFVDGRPAFSADNSELCNIGEEFAVTESKKGAVIDLLCENTGRENFGTGLEKQRKGICGSVKVNDCRHYGFEIFGLPLDERQLEKLDLESGYMPGVPAFYKFEFTADEPCDTFLDTGGFSRGCAFVNGHNIGRFRDIGPQKRLYIPAPLLKAGKNTIIIFETEGKDADSLLLSDQPCLG